MHSPLENYRKTKIVATLGPASRSEERIAELISAGVNVFRLNFSHGDHATHTETFERIRRTADRLEAHVGVLQDLSGPKIRISNVKDDYVQIGDQDTVTLHKSDGSLSSNLDIFVEGLDPASFLQSGELVLLADGIISLQVEQVSSQTVTCSVIKGGRLRSRVGIAFPDSNIDLPATTDKDLKDLQWGIENKIDFVAVSFVQSAKDIEMIRSECESKKSSLRIIAKIERKKALNNIEEIVDAADGVMVARGDLGLEIPLECVPTVQRKLIEKANQRGIPVIVATQMLHSMITSVRPTRAEVSDIASAVMSGADAVMLSEETAIGENPRESVEYLSRIAIEAEKAFEFDEYKPRLKTQGNETIADAVAYGACAAGVKIGAAAIICCTQTGYSARLISRYRPGQPLFAVSEDAKTLRQLALNCGVIPVKMVTGKQRDEEVAGAIEAVKQICNFQKGDRLIVTGGTSAQVPGSTSILEVIEL